MSSDIFSAKILEIQNEIKKLDTEVEQRSEKLAQAFMQYKDETPDPDRMYDALISAGVIVRNRSRIPGCEGCLRITVGTPAENARMIETVKNFRL